MIISSLDCNQWTRRCRIVGHKHQGPVVRRPISANPGLNFKLGLFFFCSKAFYRIIFSILFRASNHQIAGKKNKTEFAFLAFISEFKFRPNHGYLNPALNNPAPRVPIIGPLRILGDPGAVSRVGRKGGTKVFKYGQKSPWVPTLTELFPKIQADAGSWLGTKMLCIIVPNRRTVSPEFFSWVRTRQIFFFEDVNKRQQIKFFIPSKLDWIHFK